MKKEMKQLRIAAINWCPDFNDVNGSYYDYAASIYSPSEPKEQEIRAELLRKGWREIKTNTGTLVFEKDRYVIRMYSIWR